MPNPTATQRLKGLILSAGDLRSLTDWPDALIEDYLNILTNFITLAELIDVEIDQKIEEIPTDFSDGSIPFVESNLLIQDNLRFFWDALNNELNALNVLAEAITLSGATPSLLLSTDADKGLVSVAALTAWIAGIADRITVTDDGDGTITITIPDTYLPATVGGTDNEINVTDNEDGTITVGIVDPLIVAKGGIGAATLTNHGILIGSGTGAVTPLAVATNGQLPIGSTGADPVPASITPTANQVAVTNAAGRITLAFANPTRLGSAAQIGSGNYSEFEADGTLKFNGDATVFDDLRVPVNSIKVPGSKAPTWTAYSAGLLLGFSYQAVEGNEEEVYFVAQVPHSYKEGSNVWPHVHWIPDEDTTDDPEVVRWGLEYEWINIDGSFSGSTTIYAEESFTDVADKNLKTEFSAIDGTGMTISSMIVCRLFRNSSSVNDTYDSGTALALLLEFDFHFEMDTVGSRQNSDVK